MNFGEGICGGSPCDNVDGNLSFRHIASGSVVAASQALPESSTITLLALGLLGLGYARRRSRHTMTERSAGFCTPAHVGQRSRR